MNCPACTYPMTKVPFETKHIYAGDIRHERYRCEKCKVTATMEIIFSVDEHADAVSEDQS